MGVGAKPRKKPRGLGRNPNRVWDSVPTKSGVKIMYLHVGNNKNIRERDIIGIFDMDTSTVSQITRKYLSKAEKSDITVSAGEELPKSFVLYKKGDGFEICFSQLSTGSLLGRSTKK